MSEQSTDRSTLVTFLLDRTGAAPAVRDQTINAFNAYLETLKAGGDLIDFTLILFDRESFDQIHNCVPIRSVPTLKARTYVPRAPVPQRVGGIPPVTATIMHRPIPLLDAAYRSIVMIGESLQRRTDEPRIAICIHVDGIESASTEHTWDELSRLVKEKTAHGWQFNLLGAGVMVHEQGALSGFAPSHIIQYHRHNTHGPMRKVFLAAASNARSFARGERTDTGFTAQQKSDSGDRFLTFDPDSILADRLGVQFEILRRSKELLK